MNQKSTHHNQPALFVGIDWADKKHDCHILRTDGKPKSMQLEQSPEAIHEWVSELRKMADGGKIAIMLEQSKGPLIYALMHHEDIVLYPVNPVQLARYRESFPGGQGKNDPTDAMYLARMLRERIDTLKAWQPDNQETRLLNTLCEQRRLVVNGHTKLRQQLICLLKQFFPLALQLFGKSHEEKLLLQIVKRWPDPRKLRRADRKTIHNVLNEHGISCSERQQRITDSIRSAKLLTQDEALICPLAMSAKLLAQQMQQCNATIEEFDAKIAECFRAHEDHDLFAPLRGAGAVLAPRLLCAFGSDRDRWEKADELAALSGTVPITRKSGQQCTVHRRYACAKFLRQTFHEFAEAARKWCPWTKARYRMLRDGGMKHHAALRKLGRSWIRILFRVWKTRIPFDQDRYINGLKRRLPEIIPYLENQ